MGQILYNFYLRADELGGMKARTKFSMLTKLTSVEAKSMADTSENIALFEKSFKAIQEEFKTLPKPVQERKPVKSEVTYTDKEAIEKLKRQISIFADLTAQRSLYMGNLPATYKRVTESIVEGIGEERASIWLYDSSKTGITCADLFIKSTSTHSSGTFLAAKDFPAYFDSIVTERTLAAHDAHSDQRTKEFSHTYLKPLGINSMLDVPIWANNKMVGVVCHEHVGPMRTWSSEEEQFAYLMGNIVAMALESQAK